MEINLVLITVASILGATGIALIFVGMLMSLLVALGNKHYIFGVLMFLCFPIAYFYCFRHRSMTGYASLLLYGGAALLFIFVGLMTWEFNRLGVHFSEIAPMIKPVH